MTDKTPEQELNDVAELIEAARALLPYLEASTDSMDEQWAKITKNKNLRGADRLRADAADLEAKDAAIQRFRAAVAAA